MFFNGSSGLWGCWLRIWCQNYKIQSSGLKSPKGNKFMASLLLKSFWWFADSKYQTKITNINLTFIFVISDPRKITAWKVSRKSYTRKNACFKWLNSFKMIKISKMFHLAIRFQLFPPHQFEYFCKILALYVVEIFHYYFVVLFPAVEQR